MPRSGSGQTTPVRFPARLPADWRCWGDAIMRLRQVKYRTLAVSKRCGYRSDMTDRIEINPRVCGGQPVIKGTRIPVATILEQLANDESWDSLLQGYPELTRDDIQAALEYARHSILHTEITALGVA